MPERVEQVMKGLTSSAKQRAAVYHHHRDRHRRAHRQHHQIHRADCFGLARLHRQRSRAACTPGLRLPADARRRRHHQLMPKAPGSDPGHGGNWGPPCTTWKSAAPAKCWATRNGQHPGSGLRWPTRCSTKAVLEARGRRADPDAPTWPAKSICMRRPCCRPTTACRRARTPGHLQRLAHATDEDDLIRASRKN